MEHRVNLEEISDGKLYTKNDLIKLGCDGCSGKSSCCRFAEDTITLDPYDMYLLGTGEGLSFELLYARELIALSPVQGLLLPHLNFAKENGTCPFLETDGLCRIHGNRPGLCRLFPLARYFEDDKLYYILQIHECPNPVTPKVKVKNWLGIPNLEQYEAFLMEWHRLVAKVQEKIATAPDNQTLQTVTTVFLKLFYLTPYGKDEDFFAQFQKRTEAFRTSL